MLICASSEDLSGTVYTVSGTLDPKITASQSNIDAGFVYLPTLTAGDVKVMVKNTVQADAHVTVPAGSLTPSLNFEEAADPAVAHVDGSGMITGKTVGSDTTASVWVVNTLGDRIDESYQIHVLDNDTLQVTAHDWTVIQDDTVSDWWNGVTYKLKQPSLLSRLLPFLFIRQHPPGFPNEGWMDPALCQIGL